MLSSSNVVAVISSAFCTARRVRLTKVCNKARHALLAGTTQCLPHGRRQQHSAGDMQFSEFEMVVLLAGICSVCIASISSLGTPWLAGHIHAWQHAS